jgi:hypothetical protein
MPSKKLAPPDPEIHHLIREIRSQKVILDSDLAGIYGVPTFRFNEAVKRNKTDSRRISCSNSRLRSIEV